MDQEKISEYLISLGKKIKEAREEKKITQTQLSKLSGIEPAHLSRIEGGKTNPTITSLLSIAEALEMPLIQFCPQSAKAGN